MLYTVTTNTDLQTIKDELESKAKEVGFGVLKEYAFKSILEQKKYPIEHDITVYELCNPPAAQKVLAKYPEFSIFLPCRISVYEKNGKTVLSAMELEPLMQNFDVTDDVKEHMHTIFAKFKTILTSWDK